MFSWFNKKSDDLNDEIRAHLRMAANDRGEDAARREFANVGRVKEETREAWGWGGWERLWQDLRYAQRVLRKNPGYVLTAVLSLALGIGANTAIFSLIDGIMLQALPVKDPETLVSMGDPRRVSAVSQGDGGRVDLFSYPFYKRFHDENRSFAQIYASGRSEWIDLKDSAERPRARFVSNNFFGVLGVQPLLGRAFSMDDRTAVVISHNFWRQHFQGTPDVTSKILIVSHATFNVIGVAPQGFSGDVVGAPTDLWFPIEAKPIANPGRNYLAASTTSWLLLMGRLKPGVTIAQAATEANTLGKAILIDQCGAKWSAEQVTGGFPNPRLFFSKSHCRST